MASAEGGSVPSGVRYGEQSFRYEAIELA